MGIFRRGQVELIQAGREYFELMFSTGAIWAIMYALVILIIAICMGIYLESYVLRAIGLLVLAGTTYLMTPLAITRLDNQYFQSFIVEFVGGFVILVLFESWLTDERSTFMPIAVLTFFVASIFLAGVPYITRELSIEFAVMLQGAFMTTILLKREWWWADSNPVERQRRKLEVTDTHREFAEKMDEAEVTIKLMARTEDEMAYRISLMRHTLDVVAQSEPEKDRKSKMLVVYIAGKVRADAYLPEKPPEGKVQLRIIGDINLVRRATAHINEIFDVSKSSQRDTARTSEVEADIQCSVPEMRLGDVLFEHFRELALAWRNAAGRAEQQADEITGDVRKQAFHRGFARASQQAAKQLVDKLDEIGLVN
jgi:hypothetical protein